VDVELRYSIPMLQEARYVHVAEAVEDGVVVLPPVWEGVSGKVKQEADRVKKDVMDVHSKLDQLGSKVDMQLGRLEGKLDTLLSQNLRG
jgi:hypothetical protein